MNCRSQWMSNTGRITVSRLALACLLVVASCAALSQQPPSSGQPPKQPASPGTAALASGATLQITNELAHEMSYRFIGEGSQSTAPAPLPAAATAGGAVPILMPSTISTKTGTLEVVDKVTGNVARVPLSAGTSIKLTEASFKYIQTVFVTVQHDGKPVTDVMVSIANANHKFSMMSVLKKTDNGVVQFPDVPMGEPITVGINGTGHAVLTQTNTLVPAHPADGYHWPTISVDWTDVATIAPVAAPVSSSPTGTPSVSNREDYRQPAPAPERREEQGGGAFSSIVNTLLGLAVVALVIYGAIWAFNKGHIKALLDKAGINTAEISSGGAAQPSPFDKPAKPPIAPITEGTADPFGSGFMPGAAPPTVAAGPRLVATAGAYSGSIFTLAGAYTEIGRDPGNGVPLTNDTNSSRKHATVSITGGNFTVTDNGSSNGTFLNGVRIPANTPQPLRPGDELQVGMTRFRFEA